MNHRPRYLAGIALPDNSPVASKAEARKGTVA